jgi:amino acid adenylation domain-containing protein
VAAIQGEQRLSYRELDIRSNQLAHYLRGLGVGPETIVAMCVERSLEMIVCLFGILKAGGAYLPLDARHPRDRLAYLLADARAAVVLTTTALRPALPDHDLTEVLLDAQWPRIADEPAEAVSSNTRAANVAYVIYTSGSTGRPKGVMVPHRALVNYVSYAVERFDVRAGSGAPINTPLSFDATVTSLYPPLMGGQAIRLLPENDTIGSLAATLLTERNLAPVKLTPSHLDALRLLLPPNELSERVRTMVIGGEMLAGSTTQLWRESAPETRLFNHYGPTEATCGCAVYEIGRGMPQDGIVPIGRPIANAQLYVLNRDLDVPPAGVEGELYIGGDGLARAYLNRPGLTAERFVANPYGESGSRLYKTGDRARRLTDGNLVVLGRLDHQVKIRGYRVEPGEIQAALCAHPSVRQAVVIAREDQPGSPRLVGYVVANASVSAEELRYWLSRSLPDHMIPAGFVFLDELPLTPNGKLDRRALPASDECKPQRQIVGPRTLTEEIVASIWEEVLNVADIGIHDNFFELGGHSLTVVQVVAHVREALDVSLPVRTLFDAPSVAEVAAIIDGMHVDQERLRAVARLQRTLRDMSESDVQRALTQMS